MAPSQPRDITAATVPAVCAVQNCIGLRDRASQYCVVHRRDWEPQPEQPVAPIIARPPAARPQLLLDVTEPDPTICQPKISLQVEYPGYRPRQWRQRL